MSVRQKVCLFPHSLRNVDIPERKELSEVFQDCCLAHLQYFFGLQERYLPVTPDYEICAYEAPITYPRGYRGVCLHAAQNWMSASDCDDLVFKKNEVIIPTSEHACQELLPLRKNCKQLADPKFVVLNTPITKYLRQMLIAKEYVKEGLFGAPVSFEDALFDYKENITALAQFDFHLAFLTYLMEPLRKNLNREPKQFLQTHRSLTEICNKRKETHLRFDSKREIYANQYKNFSQFNKNLDDYSGYFLHVLSSIDVPIGENPDKSIAYPKGVCPNFSWEADGFSKTDVKPFRRSSSIPCVKYEKGKGFVATRDIYDGEELALEVPKIDNTINDYMAISSWIFLKYKSQSLNTDSDCTNYADFVNLPKSVEPPDTYKEYIARKALLLDLFGDANDCPRSATVTE